MLSKRDDQKGTPAHTQSYSFPEQVFAPDPNSVEEPDEFQALFLDLKETHAELIENHSDQLTGSFDTFMAVFEEEQVNRYFLEHFIDLCAKSIDKEKFEAFQTLLNVLSTNEKLTQEEKRKILFSTCSEPPYRGANLLSIIGRSKEEHCKFLDLLLDAVESLCGEQQRSQVNHEEFVATNEDTSSVVNSENHQSLYKRVRLSSAAPIFFIEEALFAKDLAGCSALYYAYQNKNIFFDLFLCVISQTLSQAPERLGAVLAGCSFMILQPSNHSICFNEAEKYKTEQSIYFKKEQGNFYYKNISDKEYTQLTREDCAQAGMNDAKVDEIFNVAAIHNDSWINILQHYHKDLLSVLFSKGDLKYCSIDEKMRTERFLNAIISMRADFEENNSTNGHHLLGKKLAAFNRRCKEKKSASGKNYVERLTANAERIRQQDEGDPGRRLKNSGYTYTDDDINSLMNAILVPEGIAAYAPQHPLVGGELQQGSIEFFQLTLKEIFSKKEVAAMLVNIFSGELNVSAYHRVNGTHWITLVIFPPEKTINKTSFEAKIVDSMPVSHTAEVYIDQIIERMKLVAVESDCTLSVERLPTEQQSSDLDCGPWGFDNAKRVALGQRLASRNDSSGVRLREEHAKTIKEYSKNNLKTTQNSDEITLIPRNGRSSLREAILDADWGKLYQFIDYLNTLSSTAEELLAYFTKRYSLLSYNIDHEEYALNELCCAALLGQPEMFKVILEFIVSHPKLSNKQKTDILFQTSVKKTNLFSFIAEASEPRSFESFNFLLEKLQELTVSNATIFAKIFEVDTEGLSAFYYALRSKPEIVQMALACCCKYLKENPSAEKSVISNILKWTTIGQTTVSHLAKTRDERIVCLEGLINLSRSEPEYINEISLLLRALWPNFEPSMAPAATNSLGLYFSSIALSFDQKNIFSSLIERALNNDLPEEILAIFALRDSNSEDIQIKIASKWSLPQSERPSGLSQTSVGHHYATLFKSFTSRCKDLSMTSARGAAHVVVPMHDAVSDTMQL